VVPIDWFYFFYFPLTALDPRVGWAITFGLGLVAFAVPWILRAPPPARARVESVACTGCTRCWKDCPYEAVMMVPRFDGTRYKQVAVVNPAKCVGCGICVGACDSAGILLGDQPVSLLGDAVVGRLRALRAASRDRLAVLPAPTIVVYTCRPMAHLRDRLETDGSVPGLPGVTVMGLPCIGTLHPEMLTKTLSAGADGVLVAGCIPEDCPFREGSQWLAERLGGRRLPGLKHVPEGRLRVRWYAPVETGRLLRDVRAFQDDLAGQASPSTP
jgi:coenzyme F420-reducing hydrogenase delta subunit/Pyruvate/2-oxoacid:ferredoxin oxidoreductase delta subunit